MCLYSDFIGQRKKSDLTIGLFLNHTKYLVALAKAYKNIFSWSMEWSDNKLIIVLSRHLF